MRSGLSLNMRLLRARVVIFMQCSYYYVFGESTWAYSWKRYSKITLGWTYKSFTNRIRSTISGHQNAMPLYGPRYFNFPDFCTMSDLEKLGLVDQNWLERNLSTLFLRTLVVGSRQQSE